MNRIKLLPIVMGVSGVLAQNDVTADYLQNANFDTTPTFVDETGNTTADVSTANENAYVIPGWTINASSEGYFRCSTVNYGLTFATLPGVMNGVNPPVADLNGATDGAVLMLSTAWSADGVLTQKVTLPAGCYKLQFDVMNQNPDQTILENRFGFLPEGGEAQYGTTTLFASEWTVETVEFQLTEETTGYICLGSRAANTGSGKVAKLAIDNVKLLYQKVSKDDLEPIIRTASETLVPGSTGEAYLQAAIDAANKVYTSASPAPADVLAAKDALVEALSMYESSALASILIDGEALTDFSATQLEYVIKTAVGEWPVIEANALAEEAGAQVVIGEWDKTIGHVEITVTSGKGFPSQVYVIKANPDYLTGWAIDGDTSKSPYDAGWRSTDAAQKWSADLSADQNTYAMYRDNLSVGRVFIHPRSEAVFSFPLKGLIKGQIYTVSCRTAKMSGSGTRPTVLAVNTKADGTGDVLGSNDKGAAKWPSSTLHTFSFAAPADGDYYLTWETPAGGDGDRSLAWDFTMVRTGEALNVKFDSQGGTLVETQFLSEGGVITEPAVPEKEGYEFDGWWYDEDGFLSKWNFALPVEGSMVLVAHWKQITGVANTAQTRKMSIEVAQNGVMLHCAASQRVVVYNTQGALLYHAQLKAGNHYVALPQGVAIINGEKVVIK